MAKIGSLRHFDCSESTVNAINAIAFSPNCRIAANGDDNGKVKLWSVKDREQIGITLEHGAPVMSLSFSPNGKFLASGGINGWVKIWP